MTNTQRGGGVNLLPWNDQVEFERTIRVQTAKSNKKRMIINQFDHVPVIIVTQTQQTRAMIACTNLMVITWGWAENKSFVSQTLLPTIVRLPSVRTSDAYGENKNSPIFPWFFTWSGKIGKKLKTFMKNILSNCNLKDYITKLPYLNVKNVVK